MLNGPSLWLLKPMRIVCSSNCKSASPAVYDAPPGPAHQLGRHQVPEAQPGEDQLQHVGVQRGHGGQRHGECWRCWRDRDMLETKLLTQIKTQTARQDTVATLHCLHWLLCRHRAWHSWLTQRLVWPSPSRVGLNEDISALQNTTCNMFTTQVHLS